MNGRTFSVLCGRSLWLALASLVVLLCSAAPLRAQVDAGSVLGTVSDASGGAVRSATVTITNEGTSASLSTTTSADGTYKFTPVRIGSYKLTATLQGFQTVTQRGVTVNVGQEVVVSPSDAVQEGALVQIAAPDSSQKG